VRELVCLFLCTGLRFEIRKAGAIFNKDSNAVYIKNGTQLILKVGIQILRNCSDVVNIINNKGITDCSVTVQNMTLNLYATEHPEKRIQYSVNVTSKEITMLIKSALSVDNGTWAVSRKGKEKGKEIKLHIFVTRK
jgi:hypothetical protein